jgi:hypothetical protein
MSSISRHGCSVLVKVERTGVNRVPDPVDEGAYGLIRNPGVDCTDFL